MNKYALVGALVLFGLYSIAHATVWYVHPDSAMNCIQDCLDSCVTGDTVLVGPGTYYECIIWPAPQSILLASEYGPDTTIIDGDSTSTVIYMAGTVDSTTVIEGFTIQNGNDINSAGIMCDNAAPTIRNNIIRNNHGILGAGITCAWSSGNPIIEGNIITHNHADSTGGGISVYYGATPRILANTIDSNTAYRGGGIYCWNSAPVIEGNVVTGNYVEGFGGGIYLLQSQASIIDNTIRANRTLIYRQGAGIYISAYSTPTIRQCDISDNFRVGIVGYSSSGTIDSCTIAANGIDGIHCEGLANPVVQYCNIYGHTLGYGLRNLSSTVTIDAENNWWGDSSGPGGFGPGTGDRVSNYVDFDPWLTDSVQGIGVEEFETEKPLCLNLQVQPNPFRHFTDIRYQITDNSKGVVLSVYDIAGRRVKDLAGQLSVIGHQSSVKWDGTDDLNRRLASGVYFVALSAGDYSEIRKVLIIR